MVKEYTFVISQLYNYSSVYKMLGTYQLKYVITEIEMSDLR